MASRTSIAPMVLRRARASWQQQGQRLRALLADYLQSDGRVALPRSEAWQRYTQELGAAVTQYFRSVDAQSRAARASNPPPPVSPMSVSPIPTPEAQGRPATITHSVNLG